MIPPQLIIPLGCLVALSSAFPWNSQPYNVNSRKTNCQSSGGYSSKPTDIPSCSLDAVLQSAQDTKSSSLPQELERIISQKDARSLAIGFSGSPGSHSSIVDSLGPSFLADPSVHLESPNLGDDSTDASHPQRSGSSGEPSHEQVPGETLTDEREPLEDHINDGAQNIGHNADNVDLGHGAHGDDSGYVANDYGNTAGNHNNNKNNDYDYDSATANIKDKSRLQSDLSSPKFRRWETVTVSDPPVAAPKPSKVPPGHTHHVDMDDDEGEE